VNEGVEVRPSAKHGTGLFARRGFRAGEVLYEVARGKVVGLAGIPGLTALERNHLDRIGEDAYEVIEPPGCDINHSCDPNSEERERRGIALRGIAAGEEITLDYDRIAHLEDPFPCRCGSACCRGVVRGRR
jgi:SET domain-containing protein